MHGQVGDAEALLLELLAGVEDGLVLGDLGDDVVAALAVHLGDALDGEVVALGGAGGEDDLLGGGADELGDLLAGDLDRLLRLPAELVVAAGGVAELAGEVRHHRLQHARDRAAWWRGCPCRAEGARPRAAASPEWVMTTPVLLVPGTAPLRPFPLPLWLIAF